MQNNEFSLKWNKDDKFRLKEKLESSYDEAIWIQAVKLYEEALEEQPDHPENLHSYGFLMEMKAQRLLKKAAKCYQKGIESDLINQDYKWIKGKLHFQLIRARAQLLENHKSINFYKMLLQKNPSDPTIYSYLLSCYLKTEQLHEAQKVMTAAYKLFPKNAMLNYYSGELLSRQGKIEEALAAWQKSAELDPQLIDAYVLEREKRYEKCVHEWQQIIAFMEKFGFEDEYPRRELERIEGFLS